MTGTNKKAADAIGWFAIFAIILTGLITVRSTFATPTVEYKDLLECGPAEGYICPATSPAGTQYQANPTCKDPSFTIQENKWVHTPNADCNTLNAAGIHCLSFRHEDLPWRNEFLKKWSLDNPETPTGMPSYVNQTNPYKKYNPQLKAMVSCNPDQVSAYLGIPRRNFEPDCRQIPDEDLVEWDAYYEGQYVRHNIAWDVCNAPVVPGGSLTVVDTAADDKYSKLLNFVADLDAQIEIADCSKARIRSLQTASSRIAGYITKAQQKQSAGSLKSGNRYLKRSYSSYRRAGSRGKRCGIIIDKQAFRELSGW